MLQSLQTIPNQQTGSVVERHLADLHLNGLGQVGRIDVLLIQHQTPQILGSYGHHFFAIAYSFDIVITYSTPLHATGVLLIGSSMSILPTSCLSLPWAKMNRSPESVPR